MSDTELVLVPDERVPDPDEPDPNWWDTNFGITVDHDGKNELYVIVGEEACGMAEGVKPEAYERLRQRMALGTTEEIVARLAEYFSERLEIDDAEGHVRYALGLPVVER